MDDSFDWDEEDLDEHPGGGMGGGGTFSTEMFEAKLREEGIRRAEEDAAKAPECTICMEEECEVWGRLDCCAHDFCLGCITAWSKRQNTCPLCKEIFRSLTPSATAPSASQRQSAPSSSSSKRAAAGRDDRSTPAKRTAERRFTPPRATTVRVKNARQRNSPSYNLSSVPVLAEAAAAAARSAALSPVVRAATSRSSRRAHRNASSGAAMISAVNLVQESPQQLSQRPLRRSRRQQQPLRRSRRQARQAAAAAPAPAPAPGSRRGQSRRARVIRRMASAAPALVDAFESDVENSASVVRQENDAVEDEELRRALAASARAMTMSIGNGNGNGISEEEALQMALAASLCDVGSSRHAEPLGPSSRHNLDKVAKSTPKAKAMATSKSSKKKVRKMNVAKARKQKVTKEKKVPRTAGGRGRGRGRGNGHIFWTKSVISGKWVRGRQADRPGSANAITRSSTGTTNSSSPGASFLCSPDHIFIAAAEEMKTDAKSDDMSSDDNSGAGTITSTVRSSSSSSSSSGSTSSSSSSSSSSTTSTSTASNSFVSDVDRAMEEMAELMASSRRARTRPVQNADEKQRECHSPKWMGNPVPKSRRGRSNNRLCKDVISSHASGGATGGGGVNVDDDASDGSHTSLGDEVNSSDDESSSEGDDAGGLLERLRRRSNAAHLL